MPDIGAQAADGSVHWFPEGTDPDIIHKTMKDYATKGGGMAAKTPQDIGEFGSAFEGAMDPLMKMRQLKARIGGTDEQMQKVDLAVQKREKDLAERNVDPLARTIGQGVVAAPLTAAATEFAGPVAGGAAAGALTGAMQPVTNPQDFWEQTGTDAMWGAAFGAGTSVALKGLNTVLGGVTDPAKKWLIAHGVQLTPGQISGFVGRRGEEAMKSFPILGSFIRGAEGRGMEGFNRAIINQGLEPIKQKLPDNVAGHDAIAVAKEMFDAAYAKALAGVTLQMDDHLVRDLTNARASASILGPDLEKQFNSILDKRLGPMLAPWQKVDVKQTIGDIRALADQFRRSNSPSERIMARQLEDVGHDLVDAVSRQNPVRRVNALQRVDKGYAMFARARDAAVKAGNKEGVFTPSQLLSAIKSQDKSRGKIRFAQGDDLLQVYARYGQKVLPGTLPDSGTTERAMWDAAGVVFAARHPYLAAGVGAASMAYTRPAISAVNRLAGSGVAPAVAAGLRPSSPYLSQGAASLFTQPSPNYEDEEPKYGGPQQ